MLSPVVKSTSKPLEVLPLSVAVNTAFTVPLSVSATVTLFIVIEAASSLVIVPTPCASEIVKLPEKLFVKLKISTLKVSSPSTVASPLTATVIVCVSPAVPVKLRVFERAE